MKEHIEVHSGNVTRIIKGEPIIVLGVNREESNFDFHVTPGATYDSILEALFSAAGMVCSQLAMPLANETEEQTKERKEAIYDWLNILASSVLKNFMPDKELRPDLTEEAIFEMENKILDETWDKATDEDKLKVKESVAEAQAKLKEKINSPSEA